MLLGTVVINNSGAGGGAAPRRWPRLIRTMTVCTARALRSNPAGPHAEAPNSVACVSELGRVTQHSRNTPQFYLTAPSPCPYLPGQEERKVFTHLVGRARGRSSTTC